MVGILSGNKISTLRTTSLSIKNKKCQCQSASREERRQPEEEGGEDCVCRHEKMCPHIGENGGAAR